jgi:hypothetical protein
VTDDAAAPVIDTSVSHSARVWNYWLGGKDCYPVDREAGDRVAELYPDIVVLARAARGFLARAVRYLADECGIRQFLDIGTGLPTASNTHQIAQSVAPESRVVYVDNDPVVLAHARALLTSTPQGATDYIDADLRDPARIVGEAARRGVTWCCPTAPTSSMAPRPIRLSRSGTGSASHRSPSAAPSRSPGSSMAWNWSSPAWSRPPGGGPALAASIARPGRWTSSAPSLESRNADR